MHIYNMKDSQILPKRMHILLELMKISKGIQGKTKLQKMMFLAKEEFGIQHEYTFEKYNYGPYSFELSNDLKALESFGLIKIDKNAFDSKGLFEGKIFIFNLTEEGELIVDKEITPKMLPETISKLQKLVDTWNKEPLQNIIKYVYSKYM